MNTYPDRKGIETPRPPLGAHLLLWLNTYPDREGIETLSISQAILHYLLNTYPDREGIETHPMLSSTQVNAR